MPCVIRLTLPCLALFFTPSPALPGAAAPAEANPRGVATFECIGLYWFTDEAGECFRTGGADRWQEGLPLVHDPRDRQYRGSVVGLTPDTAYDIELSTRSAAAALTVRTRSDRLPIGRTTHLPSGETSTPAVITESGPPDA